MPARIKLSKFSHKLGAKFGRMIGQSFAANVVTGISILTHNRALAFLYDKSCINQWYKIIQHSASYLPSINWSSKCFFAGPSIARFFGSAKSILQPYDKFFIAARNFNHAVPLIAVAVFALFNFANIEATLAVNDSGKISELFWSLSHVEFNKFSHKYPFINNYTVVNEKVHAERLNKKTRKGCDSLNSSGNLERTSRRACPASSEVTKVTEMVLNECAARLGVSLRQTEDQLTRDMLASTAAFINCTGGVNGDNPTELTREDINTVVRVLMSNNAYMISDNIEGEDKFGTAPVRKAYWGMCNTALSADLENVDGFIQADQYPSTNRTLESEWGSVGSVRFLLSSIGSVSANASNLGANVYNCFITGMEAYASVKQDAYSATFIYRPPIYDGPLALNASVGYKFAQVPRLLNDTWLINLRSTLAA